MCSSTGVRTLALRAAWERELRMRLRFLTVHLFGDFHVVAIAAVAIVEAAEDVALVAFLAGFGIALVVETGEFARAILQR
jgi:hypothetical protein